MDELNAELVGTVLAASRALVAVAAVAMGAATVEITLIQYRALVVLATRGPMPVSGLGRIMSLSPSSATRLAERLVKKDLVARRVSPASRREVELRLAPAGHDLVEVVTEARRTEIAKILERVDPGERENIANAFKVFADAAGEPLTSLPSAPVD